MQPNKKRSGCAIAACILSALLLLIVLATVQELIYESSDSECVQVQRAIPGFSLEAAALDRYLRTAFPEECADKAFVCAELRAYMQEGRMTSGTLTMEYYRFIDESRAGGNVATVAFTIDPLSGTLLYYWSSHGSGRSIAGYSEPVSNSTACFPMDVYAENLSALVDGEPRPLLRLMVENTCWGVTAAVYDDHDDVKGHLYSERITEWTPGTPFEKRSFTQVENRWWTSDG